MKTLALLLICAVSASAAARDQYASLKPLVGTWLVARECGKVKDALGVVFTREAKWIHAEFSDPRTGKSMGSADIINKGVEDHYQTVTQLPENAVLKALNLTALPGSIVVSDDPDQEDGPSKSYITYSSRVSVLTTLVTVRLRSKKKATFLFTAESPLSKDRCTGTGLKQTAPKVAP